MQTKVVGRHFFFGLLFVTFLFTFLIFRPFWIVLILGISFSIVLYPLFEWFTQRGLRGWLASLLAVLLFTVILLGPILGIGILVFHQSQDLYSNLLGGVQSGSFLEAINRTINSVLPSELSFDLGQQASEFFAIFSRNVLMLLAIFYFLKDGANWRRALVVLSPLSDRDDEKIISRFKSSVSGVMLGYLLVALVQGLLMGTGLWLFGVPKPALWGVVAAVASLVPIIGTALISIPVFVYLVLLGSSGQAIGFLVWATAIVGMVDNFLNPLFIGRKIDIPPLFILFSVLGGISLLGPVGVLVGPLTVSLLYTLISIYLDEFKENHSI
jgi:predicted PurR-regulated permease PerM